jgi:Mn2+/Fe2+ NRAMP family transporter
MTKPNSKIDANRQLLTDAQSKGAGPTLRVFLKLSGPGWLQSAITLGGGSLASALFLGVLGGTNLLWPQLVAISTGVVMLSAISYVTLSTGERPFHAINKHINPVLGWGWLLATCAANMIWCMPQFSLCYEALQKNLAGSVVGDGMNSKLMVSAVLLAATGAVVVMNSRQGLAAKFFDWFLKALVGMIVICFFGAVICLGFDGQLNFGAILAGCVPDLRQWTQPTGDVAQLVFQLPADIQEFWSGRIVKQQRSVMIAAAATAVGINMTFLLPYSMLSRGWDRPFRGLARFDLATGMAIPYILVTSCVVIASAASFHAKIDSDFASNDPAVMQKSKAFGSAKNNLMARLELELGATFTNMSESEQLEQIAALSLEEKKIASSLVRHNALQLSKSLVPFLGEKNAALVFGIGIFGMGFSTIIILMLINGYVFCEMFGLKQGGPVHVIGCLVAGVSGAAWPLIWDDPDTKLWLAVLTSTFGMMLLPIAYITFFMMMNSKTLMGDQKPTGGRMMIWNVLMIVSVLIAIVAAGSAIWEKVTPIVDPEAKLAVRIVGGTVLCVTIGYALMVIVGFALKSKPKATED